MGKVRFISKGCAANPSIPPLLVPPDFTDPNSALHSAAQPQLAVFYIRLPLVLVILFCLFVSRKNIWGMESMLFYLTCTHSLPGMTLEPLPYLLRQFLVNEDTSLTPLNLFNETISTCCQFLLSFFYRVRLSIFYNNL